MDQMPHEAAGMPVSTTLAHLRRRKREATQALLGDTIAISDQAWQEPSRLPGWTRAHVATHLARSADAMRRVAQGLLTHTPARLYPDDAARGDALEQGSMRSALELQIDLDTSAGMLNDTLNYVEEGDVTDPVELEPGRWMPAHHLAVARLSEVVLHHIDLDCGFTAHEVEGDIARWLLEWTCQRLDGDPSVPPLSIASSSGLRVRTGVPGEAIREVHGTDAALLGWLTGRGGPETLSGAGDLTLPLL